MHCIFQNLNHQHTLLASSILRSPVGIPYCSISFFFPPAPVNLQGCFTSESEPKVLDRTAPWISYIPKALNTGSDKFQRICHGVSVSSYSPSPWLLSFELKIGLGPKLIINYSLPHSPDPGQALCCQNTPKVWVLLPGGQLLSNWERKKAECEIGQKWVPNRNFQILHFHFQLTSFLRDNPPSPKTHTHTHTQDRHHHQIWQVGWWVHLGKDYWSFHLFPIYNWQVRLSTHKLRTRAVGWN